MRKKKFFRIDSLDHKKDEEEKNRREKKKSPQPTWAYLHFSFQGTETGKKNRRKKTADKLKSH